VITPKDDVFGHNTVVGPNKSTGWSASNICTLLFPHDVASSLNQNRFGSEILPKMKKGESNIGRFSRTLDDGTEETLILAYAPIHIRTMLPLRPDDFEAGVSLTWSLAYSIGIGLREHELLDPFEVIEENVHTELNRISLVFLCVVFAVSAMFTVFACLVSFRRPICNESQLGIDRSSRLRSR
jgi:hypothetical protein